jgi:hypothetical protein
VNLESIFIKWLLEKKSARTVSGASAVVFS